ncbi:MAG: biotin/lipoyl-containing protein [Bacteroidales bacterium]|nr:biotin/lipoyl-containing protein [Bacteroidales bacterium]
MEIQLNDRTAQVEKISEEGSKMVILVDDKEYEVDIIEVEKGVYSLLHQGKSYNVELIPGPHARSYNVNTLYNSYDAEIIDGERKYQKSRRGGAADEETNISSPMPGKVVSIPFAVGDEVSAGDTVIIVSAMKMESEYKVKQDRVVKDILVKEGDVIKGNQTLVVVE